MAAPVLQSQLDAVGRERGPDIALKSDKLAVITNDVLTALDGQGYDVNQFNITEVLNVIAAISNDTRTAAAVDAKYSAHIPTCGGIDPARGVYANAGAQQTLQDQTTAAGGVYNNIFGAGGGLDGAHFDFNDLTNTVGAITLPQCLLKRTSRAGGAPNEANLILPPLVLLNQAQSVKFIGDVFRQGFSILEKTRDVFGPKGWTALFSQVKGGGSSRSKNAKRTHRHRRRYSSKQY